MTNANTGGVEEWIDKALPAGSGRYYAALHSDSSLQSRQKLYATLISIFSKLGFQSREIEVARHKLEWWRTELEKETHNHPVMVALSYAQAPQHTNKHLQQLLAGYGMLLTTGSPSTDNENKQFHLNTGATACHLLCETEEDTEVLNDVGITLSRFRCLRNLRQHIENGLLCLPMSAIETANLSPAQLTPGKSTPEAQAFLLQACDKLLSDMQNVSINMQDYIAEANSDEQRKYKALYVYLVLQTKLLTTIQKDGAQLLTKETRHTPIKNYWHALKAARAFEKLC